MINLGNPAAAKRTQQDGLEVADEATLSDQPQAVRQIFSELDAAIKETEKH